MQENVAGAKSVGIHAIQVTGPTVIFDFFLGMYKAKEYLIHGLLLVLTLITTTLAGGEWVYGRSVIGEGDSFLTWEYFLKSMAFSIPFVGILLIHELGHFFLHRCIIR